jgi:hypothetical protein
MSVADDAVEHLFRRLESVLEHDHAVTLIDLIGWRATDALDRALDRDWR